MEFGPIECLRVCLRAFTEDDLEAFAAYRADPDVARYQSWSAYSLAEAEALYAEQAAKPFRREGEWYQIAIAEREGDKILGDLALHLIDSRQAEVGFTLAPRFQGQGYGREALSALVDYLFDVLRLNRVIAITDTRNRSAIRLLEACGFDRLPRARTIAFKGRVCEEWLFERFSAK